MREPRRSGAKTKASPGVGMTNGGRYDDGTNGGAKNSTQSGMIRDWKTNGGTTNNGIKRWKPKGSSRA